jgi:YGGT family protein
MMDADMMTQADDPDRYDDTRTVRDMPAERVSRREYVRDADAAEPAMVTTTRTHVGAARRLTQLVYLVFGLLEVLLLFRLVLKLLAANPGAGFTSLVYQLSEPFVALFRGVFPTPAASGSVLELFTVLAMIVYAVVAWAIGQLILIAGRR